MTSLINKNIKFKKFFLTTKITNGKPGELIDLNINNICEENGFFFFVSKMFYINELNSELSRGNHSNSNASEILICLNGSFEIKLHDGKEENILLLNKNDAIFINNNIWIEFFNFKDCIILAFVNILNTEPDSY
jgi:hypothetical protein